MDTENLRLLIEAAESITLQILFVIVLDIMEDFVTNMVWYVIVLIFLLKLFALFAAHLVAKRMGDTLGYYWPYSDEEKDRIYDLFMKGLMLEEGEVEAKEGGEEGAYDLHSGSQGPRRSSWKRRFRPSRVSR